MWRTTQLWRSVRAHLGRWRPVALLLAWSIALGPASLSHAQAGPRNWQASVGGQTDNQAIQALAFFPLDLSVNVQDTITWTWQTAEPHTVTFLAPNQLPPLAPPPNNTPATANTTVNGTDFVNSGRKNRVGDTFTATFSTPGVFNYLCLVHPRTMTARVTVNPAGTPYPHSQAFFNRQGAAQLALILSDGRELRQNGRDIAQIAGRDNVSAGAGDAEVFVARFLPEQRRIRVGETVVWTNSDSITPHTVTFGPTPSNAAVGLDGPGHATISSNPVTTTISSGLFGVGRDFTQFKVQFTVPGTYPYFCSLHSDLGMVGTIVVRPSNEPVDD